ncbi:MAG: sigma-54-dependent Fis family transcriptional regulator [Verrucomicrobia bacterium]|nr:sigma-54-dependent Fis family transcriptional regulator [Verrucomicrobiota bacterium]
MKKALIIDSSGEEVGHYVELLSKEGIASEICSSAAETSEFLESAKIEDFCLVLLRWEFPGPPFAFELLFRCKQARPKMPIIIISGVLDVALAARAIALGADDFLQKPLDGLRLRKCVWDLLADRPPNSPLLGKLQEKIIGQSRALCECLEKVARVIPHADKGVLIQGESGTGKELLAQAIHKLSQRAAAPWVALNVGAISKELVESEIFGHERGAFTGAAQQHIGYLERADEGTILLDEIGDLPEPMQIKLLRVLQEKEFQRVGGTKPIPFKARLVCATHIDLPLAVKGGAFRLDLYHRIAETSIRVPPLREREQDIDLLVEYFTHPERVGRTLSVARETRTILRSYPFPGNIRELEKLLGQAIIACEGDTLLPKHLPLDRMAPFVSQVSEAQNDAKAIVWPEQWFQLKYKDALAEVERAFDRIYLKRAYDQVGGRILKAAAMVGIDRKTFTARWKDCGLAELEIKREGEDG